MPGRPAAESRQEYERATIQRNYGDAAMSTKKPRKSLEDSVANEFVYDSQKQLEVNSAPEVEHNHEAVKSEEKPVESNLVSKF